MAPKLKSHAAALMASTILICSAAYSFAQDSFSISPISSPSMPSISTPSIGSGFYVPGNPSNPVYTGNNSTAAQSQTTTTTTESTEKKSDEEKSKTKSMLSTLTASDLALFSTQGTLSQLDTLLNSSDSFASQDIQLTHLYSAQQTSETSLLLNKILLELEELKQLQAALQTEDSTTKTEVQQKQEEEAQAKSHAVGTNTSRQAMNHPRLLRFTVNGYDILSTCRNVYISDIQKDGTFLLTADRRYQSDGKYRTETFHILFQTSASSPSPTTYMTATAVTQDYFNPYSFVYQMSQKTELEATRTGNLVTMRTNEPTWKLEMLIDLGNTTKPEGTSYDR